MTRPFTPAWLAGEPSATPFLPRGFAEPEARAEAVRRAATQPIEAPVLSAFAAQEARRPWSKARAHNLERLARGAAVVVTGQQVGLFLGPLYTLHKAASAIADAAALERETGHAVVPVFWLQTEDHDFDEVRTAVTPAADGPRAISADDASGAAARASLSERRLGPDVIDAITRLGLGGAHAEATAALIARHYRPGRSWAEAFGDLLAELFGAHGLLVFDPRAATAKLELARLAAPVHTFALRGQAEIAAALEVRAEALAAAGFAVQVAPRRGCALSCHAPHMHDARHRLERDGAGWIAGHTRLDADALSAALAHHPERFTTTALLRPLLQDTLLPTAAYVGGPGELAYFAELHPLYELAARMPSPGLRPTAMPLAVPRARFTLTTAATRRIGEELGLGLDDAATARAELLARVTSHQDDLTRLAALERDTLAAIEGGLAGLAREAERAGDGAFAKHGKKAEEIVRGALERLFDRSRRLALDKDVVQGERLTRWQTWLAPRGEPQERVLGFAAFAAQVGAAALVERIVASVVPFSGDVQVIDL